MNVKNISKERIHLYLKKLQKQGDSPFLILKKLTILDKFLSWACQKKLIKEKVFKHIKKEIDNIKSKVKSQKSKVEEEKLEKENILLTESPKLTPAVTDFEKAAYLGEKKTEGIFGEISLRFNLQTYKIKSLLFGWLKSLPLLSNKKTVIKKELEKEKNIISGFDISNLGIHHYIGLLLFLLFLGFLGAGIYNQFFLKIERPLAYPINLTRGGRVLSFQGRLTDSLGNPITTATNVQFKLYDVATGGTPLYTAGPCSTTPDQDGIFSTLIGQSCGSEIPNSIFTENSNVYLGVTVGADSEMTPRQPIANVGYAINAETLQGFPPGTGTSNIPFINQDGNLLIAVASPGIHSTFTSADFTVSSAKTAIIQSAGSGDVVLQATGSGTLKFRTAGDNDSFNRMIIDNNGLVGIGTTPTQKLEVSGNIYANSGQIRLGSFASSPTAIGAGSLYYNSTTQKVYYYNGSAWTEMGAGSSWWTQNLGLLYPINSTLDLAIGGTASSSAKFAFTNINSGTPTLKFNQASAFDLVNSTVNALDIEGGLLSFDTSNSRIGIGTTSPSYTLDVSGAGRFSTSLTTPTIIGSSSLALKPSSNSTAAIQLQNAAGTSILNIDTTNQRVGIGTTSPGTKLDIIDNSGGLETPFKIQVSDNTNDYWSVSNSTGTGGVFIPSFYIKSDVTLYGTNVYNSAFTTFANPDTAATSGYGAMHFDSRKYDNSGPLANKNLFSWGSYNIVKMVMSASGNVGIGTTTPNQTLSVAGTLGIREGGTSPQYYTIFQGGDQTANITYTLPTSIVNNGFLTTNSSGVLSWTTTVPASSVAWSNLTNPNANLSLNHNEYTSTFTWDTAATAGSFTGLTLSLTNDATTDTNTQRILALQNNSATGGTTENLLYLNNADDNVVTSAIVIGNTGGGGFTNFLDTPSLDITGTGVITGATGISSSGTITFSGLTANRLVTTDGSSNLTTSISSTNIAASVTDETGTGNLVFSTSPTFSTSLLTDSTSFNVFNTIATTINAFGAATTLNMGANSGTLTIGNPTVVGTQTTQNLWNTIATTINFAGAATALNIGASSGTTTINNTTLSLPNATSVNIGGASSVLNFSSSTGVKQIQTGGTTNLALMPGGNVGIGTTTPNQTLSVAGTLGIREGGTSPQYYTIFQGGDQSGDITYTLPTMHTTNGVLTNNGSGTLSWSLINQGNITPDSLDFTEFQDTLDLDADLVLNQGTYTWTQNFTGTTGTGLTYNANSLTSGTGLSLSSSSTSLTGDLVSIIASGNNAGVTGNALKVGLTGASATGTALNITTAGSSGYALRVNDDGTFTDSTPFVVDVSGNVGVGTTSPQAKLEVVGDIYGSRFIDRDNTIYGLDPAGNTLTNSSSLYTAYGAILAGVSGNVGIGTTAPASKLHILGSTDLAEIKLERGGGGSLDLTYYYDGTHRIGFTDAGAPGNWLFRVNYPDGTTWLAPGGGNVGIGTANPGAKLHISSNSGNQLKISRTGSIAVNDYNFDIHEFNSSNGYLAIYTNSSNNNYLYLVNNGTGTAGLISEGNVSIGMTGPPVAKLSITTTGVELSGTAASTALRINAGQLGANAGDRLKLTSIGFSTITNAISLGIEALRTNNGNDWTTTAIGLKMDVDNTSSVNNAEIWLTNTGKVGIGTTNPAEKLDISGNATASGNITMGGQLQIGRFNSTPTPLGSGTIIFNSSTNNFQCYNGTNWFNCGGTLYSNTNFVSSGNYLTVTHNLNTTDLLTSAWIYDEALSKWMQINTADTFPLNPSDTTMKAFYKMEETSGNLTDASGNNNTLTASGSANYSQTGKTGNAISFNGTNTAFFCSDSNCPDFKITDKFTLGAWIKADNNSLNGHIKEIIAKWQQKGNTFSVSASYSFFNTASLNANSKGFYGAVFDGRYIYFVPYFNTAYSGQVTRYDTTGSFTQSSSWSFFDTASLNANSKGFYGAVFDGRYIYFVPYNNGNIHGQVTRFDALGNTQGAYKLSYSQNGQDGSFSGSTFGPRLEINTNYGNFSVSANKNYFSSTWHQITGTFDGTSLKLYVDGQLVAQNNNLPPNVAINNTTDSFTLGSLFGPNNAYYKGLIDEVFVFNRALDAGEVWQIYQNLSQKFQIQIADNNNVRLYNYSNYTQQLKLTVTGASTTNLANPWTDAGNYLYPTGYESLRIYDGAGANYLSLAHDGTKANFDINGSTKMVINSSGNVGIGTTNPGAKLDVIATAGQNPIASLTSPDTLSNRWVQIGNGSAYMNLGIASATTPNNTQNFSYIWSSSDKFMIGSDGNPTIVVSGMTNGNVGIGTTNPSYKLQLSLDSAAKPTTNTWTIASDARIKNVVGNYNKGLTEILQINPIIYTYKENNALGINDPGEHIGIIAQEVQKVFPEAVSINNIGYLHFNSDALSWASINAIKELNNKISTISSQLTDLSLTSTGDFEIKRTGENYEYVYNGNSEEIRNSKFEIRNSLGEIIDRIGAFAEIVAAKIKTGLLEAEDLIANNILVAKNIVAENIQSLTINVESLIASQKITSPIIETERIELKSQNSKLKTTNEKSKISIVDKDEKPLVEFKTDEKKTLLTGEVEVNSNQEKGKLAQIVLKNLEGKTAVYIDASGNASFSGSITVLGNLNNQGNATIAGTLSTNTFNASEASISGKLIAKEVEAENINEIQRLLAEIKNQPLPDLENQTNLSNTTDLGRDVINHVSTNNLMVTGQSNLYNVSISGSLLVNQTLIENNSILALASELKLSALNKITLFDGAVTIAKDGTITTKGTLIAQSGIQTNKIFPIGSKIKTVLKKGQSFTVENNDIEVASIDASGSAYFKNIALEKFTPATPEASIIAASENFTKNGIFAPAIEASSSAAGFGIIPRNSQEVVIYSSFAKTNSLIYLTPKINQPISLSVFEKKDGYFRVIRNQLLDQEVNFDWLIIN